MFFSCETPAGSVKFLFNSCDVGSPVRIPGCVKGECVVLSNWKGVA